MGTIIQRTRKTGQISFYAQAQVIRNGLKFRKSKTFDRRPAAQKWIEATEKALADPAYRERLDTKSDVTLADAIDKYLSESVLQIGRTKAQVLRSVKDDPIASKECSKLTSEDFVDFGKKLLEKVQPQTVMNYMSHLMSVAAVARPAWGIPLPHQEVKDAVTVMKRLGMVSKSKSRDRRPTLDELDRLLRHFVEVRHRRPTSLPMAHIIAFAIFSTRRQEEIVSIRWDDLDEEGNRVLVRDMKHPGQKVGNNVWCELTPEAMRMIRQRKRLEEVIWPYTTDAIGAAFSRACKLLEIEDLHFHDLRHEGITRLFEMGLTIPKVASFSGHRSWQSLERYTHIRHTGDRYAGWKWLEAVTT